jgi:predicted ABC-type exoprotein transport system permease subunit
LKNILSVKNSILFSGYFAYGGSTIVVVFKAGMVKWDDDLQHNSHNSMETLVHMGEQIGQRRTEEERRKYLSTLPKPDKKNSTITQLLNHFPLMNSIK